MAETRPGQSSTTELFLEGINALIVIHLPSDFRLLNLNIGQIETKPRARDMKAFRKWSLAVRDTSGAVSVVAAF